MKARVTLITLGVDDLDRSVRFHRDGLGWPAEGIVGRQFEHGAVAFCTLQGGLKLALWPRRSLAHDSGPSQVPASSTEFILAYNVRPKQEVDAVMREAKAAGATAVKPATILSRGPFRLFQRSGRPSPGGRLESADDSLRLKPVPGEAR